MPAQTREGRFDELPTQEPFTGVLRRSFDSSCATVNEYSFAPGARFPIHRHPSEQVTLVMEGEVELTVEGDARTLGTGEWSVVAGDVAHGITASAQGARILAIVMPRREQADDYTLVEETS